LVVHVRLLDRRARFDRTETTAMTDECSAGQRYCVPARTAKREEENSILATDLHIFLPLLISFDPILGNISTLFVLSSDSRPRKWRQARRKAKQRNDSAFDCDFI
jgi:hypothetical protein